MLYSFDNHLNLYIDYLTLHYKICCFRVDGIYILYRLTMFIYFDKERLRHSKAEYQSKYHQSQGSR